MQFVGQALLALLLWAVSAEAKSVRAHQDVTPIGKVLELLEDLKGKLLKEADKADRAYEEYTDWCKVGKKDMEFKITTTQAEIDDLTATIEKAKSDFSSETTRIEALAASIAEADADLKAAAAVREREEAEYAAAEKELVDVVDTLDRAINVLERKLKGSALVQATVDTQNVEALLHSLEVVLEAAALSTSDKSKLMALAQQQQSARDGSEDAELGAPAADAYKSHSGNIVEVLEDMRGKAETQLSEVRKQETNAKHHFEMTRQSLEDQVAADDKELGQAKTAKANAAEVKSASEGDLKIADEALATAETTLAEMSKGCNAATEDHEAEKKSREEELKAVEQAKKIISDTTKGAETSAYGGASALIQLRAGHQRRAERKFSLSTSADLANFEVVNILRQLAKKERSPQLAQLSSRVAAAIHLAQQAGEDPFSKVKALIEGLIEKLEKDAGQDAEHKRWCDKEYGDTKEKQDDLTDTLESLSIKIDKAQSLSMTLKDEVKETQGALVELLKSQAEADKARTDENSAYQATKSDLDSGLTGVREAIKVLREYYSGDDAAHKKSEAGGSIIGLLEVVESDLSKALAEATSDEDAAAAEYQKVSMSNKLTKVSFEQDLKYKTKEAAGLDKSVTEMSADREGDQQELDSVLEYSKSIRASCEVKPETYEDRKARRDAELAGLKSALEVLSSGASLVQKDRHVRHLRT